MSQKPSNNPELLDKLRNLARKATEPYLALPETKAILLIGSSAYGIVDSFSDLDIALYYDNLPSQKALDSARAANGVESLNWALGDRDEGGWIESYNLHGIECQFAHSTLECWEKEAASVLEGLDVNSPIQKALSGVLAGITLFGAETIESLQKRAAEYPYALGVAMVSRYLAFQPLWLTQERLKVRDAILWQQQALVEGAQNILGVLAGLNHLYYSTFQFKRMSFFVEEMKIKPVDLNSKLRSMIQDGPASIGLYKDLVAEVVGLVERQMPEVETAAIRARLSKTEQPWDPDQLAV